MKKLLVFHPYLAPYRVDVYNRLANMTHMEVLLTGSKSEIKGLGFNLENINNLAKFKYEYYSKGIRIGRHLISSIYYKKIKAMRPDVILSHELGVNTLIAIFLKKIFNYKIYTTIDDSPAMVVKYSILRNLLRNYVLNHIDGAITVNPAVCNFLSQKYKKTKCKFTYFPIIQDDIVLSKKINLSKDIAQYYINQFNIKEKRIILFVGRLESIKAPDLLLYCYHKYINKENTLLVIVGNGSLYNKLHKYVQSNKLDKNVILTGSLSGDYLYAWYYLSHIFILPSKFEPFGAVVNEALVAGCKTVVSNHVGASCLINKNNGIIFDIYDSSQLIDAISNLLSTVPLEKEHKSLMEKNFEEFYNILVYFMGI